MGRLFAKKKRNGVNRRDVSRLFAMPLSELEEVSHGVTVGCRYRWNVYGRGLAA